MPIKSFQGSVGKTRDDMEHAAIYSVLLLLAASFSAAASSSSSHPHRAPSFIRGACKATRYPRLCEQCLASYEREVHRSPRALARAALAVSVDRARSASSFVRRVSSAGGESRRVRTRETGAVRDCLETLSDSVDQLRQSVCEMRRMGRARSARFAWHLSNVQTWVSAALTDETTCLDSLSQNAGPAVRATIRKRVVKVTQVTSNALALVNKLDPRN